MARALRIFFHSDLRCMHEGLALVAKKAGIVVDDLEPGNYVIFINEAQNRIKLFASNNVVAYYKSPHGRIDLRAIGKIPAAFQASGKIDYDDAIKKVIEKELMKRGG